MLKDELWKHQPEFRDEEKQRAGRDDGVHEKTYDSNKYVSGAKRVPNGTVPMNILQFQYPFCYTTVKRSLDPSLSSFESHKCSPVPRGHIGRESYYV